MGVVESLTFSLALAFDLWQRVSSPLNVGVVEEHRCEVWSEGIWQEEPPASVRDTGWRSKNEKKEW